MVGRRCLRGRSQRRLLVFLTVFGVAAALAPAALATRFYTPTISPTSAAAGSTTSFTVTIKNTSPTSTSFKLGSANVTVPAGFALSSVSTVAPPAGKAWTATPAGAVLQLRAGGTTTANRLSPGQAVSVTFSANVRCALGSSGWTTAAKEGNLFTGSSFSRVGPEPVTSVVPGPVAAFSLGALGGQTAGVSFPVTVNAVDGCHNPTDDVGGAALGGLGDAPDGTAPIYGALSFSGGTAVANVTAFLAGLGQTLAASNGSVAGSTNVDVQPGPPAEIAFVQQPTDTEFGATITPAVTTFVTDAYENPVDTSVTLEIGSNPPGNGVLSGSPTQPSTGGTATFGNLSIAQPGIGYTLVAEAGAASATSTTFNITSDSVACSGVAACSASTGTDTSPTNTTVAQASVPAGAGAGTLSLTVFNVPGSPCDGTVGTGVTIGVPPGVSLANPLVFWLEIDRSQLPTWWVDLLPIISGQQDFSTAFDIIYQILVGKRVTFCKVDDDGHVTDPIPFCWKAGPPCIAKQRRDLQGDLRVKFLLTKDPFVRGR